jgi:hypothetical protein
MKKKSGGLKAGKTDWDKVCEETRQRCNKLSDEERERLEEQALRIIYGHPPKAATRSR